MSNLEPMEIPDPAQPVPPARPRTPKTPARQPQPARQHEGAWNLLSAFLLAATFFVASFYVLIYTRPELVANSPLGFLIAPSATLQTAQPSALPSSTPEPTSTQPPATPQTPPPSPTATLQAVEATPLDPNITPQTTSEAVGFYPFALQGQVSAIDGTVIDQNHGCNWMGVAGRILDADGSPIVGLQVHLVGYIDGRTRDLLTLSGTGQAFGPAGYEFTLATRPIRTIDSIWIQLVEQNGLPLSARIRFDTYAECDKNLIVINFVKVK